MISTQLPFNALTSAIEGFSRVKGIEVHTFQSAETRAPIVLARKGSYEFSYTMSMFMSIDEFFGEVAHLFYELDQHDKGLWISVDNDDQLQINFNLLKIMEDHYDEKENGTYPIKMQ